jgi:hypothetical protein
MPDLFAWRRLIISIQQFAKLPTFRPVGRRFATRWEALGLGACIHPFQKMSDSTHCSRNAVSPVVGASLLCIAAIISVAVAWRWKSPVKASLAPELVVKPSRSTKEAMVVPGNFAWDKLSEDELREFMSFFGERKSPHRFQWKTKVALGESVITEAYEGQPGEFVFTELTPGLKSRDGVAPELVFDMSSFKINLAGERTKIWNYSWNVIMTNGKGSLKGTNYRPDGIYKISIDSTMQHGDPSISIDTSGGFEDLPKKQSPAD